MKKFAIAKLCFLDNLNEVKIVEANSPEEALVKLAGELTGNDYYGKQIEDIQSELFDCELSVSNPLEI